MDREQVVRYIELSYAVTPQSPWAKFPEYLTFKHVSNSKWFAVIMNVSEFKLMENGKDIKVDIINLKIQPEIAGSLRLREGIYPAYHMNKEHWISIRLGSHLSDEELSSLIDESYKLTL